MRLEDDKKVQEKVLAKERSQVNRVMVQDEMGLNELRFEKMCDDIDTQGDLNDILRCL